MNDNIIKLEMRLLIARYGYQRVLRVLAETRDSDVKEIEKELSEIEEKAKRSKLKKKNSVEELVMEACTRYPAIAGELQSFVSRFESRTFLPELKDVRHFLQRYGKEVKSLKSRKDSFSQVLNVLVLLSPARLQELLDDETVENDSTDYSLLADQIMGKNSRTKHAAR